MTRRLYTLAYPRLDKPDRDWIDRQRSAHDPDAARVAPHFTLVFSCTDIDERAYCAHIARLAGAELPVRFHCRRVAVGTDHADGSGYVFLVPDEGNSGLHRLHDVLYSGALAPALRVHIPFVPHLTLGQTESPARAKALCDALNATGMSIAGLVDSLTVVSVRGARVEDVARFSLLGSDTGPG